MLNPDFEIRIQLSAGDRANYPKDMLAFVRNFMICCMESDLSKEDRKGIAAVLDVTASMLPSEEEYEKILS